MLSYEINMFGKCFLVSLLRFIKENCDIISWPNNIIHHDKKKNRFLKVQYEKYRKKVVR